MENLFYEFVQPVARDNGRFGSPKGVDVDLYKWEIEHLIMFSFEATKEMTDMSNILQVLHVRHFTFDQLKDNPIRKHRISRCR